MAVFDTHQEKKDQPSKSGSSSAGGSQQKSGGGGNGGGQDDPVKAAAQAIVAYADIDPALLGPNQQLRDMVDALRKALAAGESK